MRNPQTTAFIFLAITAVLFLFSLALLPPVELYCRFRAAAVALFIVNTALLVVISRRRRSPEQRPLAIGSYVFLVLGLLFNVYLLISVRGRC